jgi:valyl-tRNA synthetase
MSKSLGNSPDPLELMARYGADGVRTGMLFSSPAGNDLLFDEKLCEQGRNFANKIWNAFRLLKGLAVEEIATPEENTTAGLWFESKLSAAITELEDHFSKFRISDALLTTYKLVWDDYCAWYLEIIKPEYGKPIDRATMTQATGYFEQLLKLLHPFMPFISEELWHELRERTDKDCITVAAWPAAGARDGRILESAAQAFAMVTEVRNVRNGKGLSPKEKLTLLIKSGAPADKRFTAVVQKLANLESISESSEIPAGSAGFMAGTAECFIPLADSVDPAQEQAAILKEIEYLEGFLVSIDRKLGNEKFVSSAPPAVVDLERRKKSDAEAKLAKLRERIKN